ncbi:FtsQ-type POTRA domain-containing protein [Pelagibacteraceae bacterium]|nr:FtsQ-type POTRA domain-containing protein [Pelagibacteraceae bacterium]
MKSSIKIYFLIFIFFIFSTYNFKLDNSTFSILFPIKKILIENNKVIESSKLKLNLSFLNDSSLFFLNEEKILAAIKKYDFIASIQLKKKYPNTLKIIIIEKIPVAIQIVNKKKFYITRDNKKINFIDLNIYEDLPLIFGKYVNFNIFYNHLEKNNFKMSKIKSFYYFDVGRWDIILKNKKTIKFPEKNYLDLLPKINLMLEDNNFSKYKIFDFRIKDQLILR